jgi:hypothetical protein
MAASRLQPEPASCAPLEGELSKLFPCPLSAGEWVRLAFFSLSRDLLTLLTNPDCAQGASAEAVTYNLSQYMAIGARDAGQFRLAQASPSLDSDGHTLEETI